MAQEDWYMKQGDTAPPLRLTLKDAADAAVDITGGTVKFSMVNIATNRQRVNKGTVTILTALVGDVEYPWVSGDTDDHGRFRAEFQVTYAGGKIETFPNNRANPLIVFIDPEGG